MWFVKSSTNYYQVLLHAHFFLLQVTQVSSQHKQQLSSSGEQCSFSDIRQLWWIHTILYRGLIQVFPQ
jgi:hypothetical protein